MKIAATTSLPAVDRPNANLWNAARSCQKMWRKGVKKKLWIKNGNMSCEQKLWEIKQANVVGITFDQICET